MTLRSHFAPVLLGFLSVFLLGGCDGWRVDYGTPAAQFEEAAVLAKAVPYVGKKVTVRGTVTRHDLSDPEHHKLYLGHGICCDFGRLGEMAKGYAVGETVYVDGILKQCEAGGILLAPAMGRDPTAPFDPVK